VSGEAAIHPLMARTVVVHRVRGAECDVAQEVHDVYRLRLSAAIALLVVGLLWRLF
jgi:hypothetical protein